MSIHVFASTGEAYDHAQYGPYIADGDILIVPSEKVAGFVEGGWPIAATIHVGEFHSVAEGQRIIAENRTDEDGKYLSRKLAEACAALEAYQDEDLAWDLNARFDAAPRQPAGL